MNPTSRAILQTVIATDASLNAAERDFVQRLISGHTDLAPPAASSNERLLVTQKRAAKLLSLSRATVWRMTKDCILHPIEVLPGTWRHSLREISTLARTGGASPGDRRAAPRKTRRIGRRDRLRRRARPDTLRGVPGLRFWRGTGLDESGS